jgi:membrane protein DedA with SNARE-associated domain/rhodanese-related sulfurtransferase
MRRRRHPDDGNTIAGSRFMHDIPSLIRDYGIVFVFAAVLVEGIGIPVPSFAVVVLAASVLDRSQLGTLFLAALSAGLLTDLAWYWAGKRLGYRLLRTLCRLSLSADSCVMRTEALFVRWGLSSLLVARFLPGYSTIAQPLAGALRQPFAPFLFYDLLGAVLWCMTGIVLGAVFSSAVGSVLDFLDRFGTYGTLTLIGAFLTYVAYRWYRRQVLIKQLRMDRISVQELRKLILDGSRPVLIDIRSDSARAREGTIPSSVFVDPAEIEKLETTILSAQEIVIYCACPNEASAAVFAQRLMARGAKRVRPLHGGIDAWTDAGFEVDAFSVTPAATMTAVQP